MKLSIIIPAFNEEGNIEKVYTEVLAIVQNLGEYEFVFVDDGSSDKTLEKIQALAAIDPAVFYLSFSRNFGHQNALKCGIEFASGDAVISMDADLQHPPELIPDMVQQWKNGFDIVYTVRKPDPKLRKSKSLSSGAFYRVMNWLSDVDLEEGSADFRLIDRTVAIVISQNKENNLFLRGYVSWLGFRQYKIEYIAAERFSGQTKYSYRKMISFAINGITSFSVKPLRFSILLGLTISFGAFLYGLYAIYEALFTDRTVVGWASMVVSVLFIGGIQLIVLGVIGEYLGKLFMQSKQRPSYVVKSSKTPAK